VLNLKRTLNKDQDYKSKVWELEIQDLIRKDAHKKKEPKYGFNLTKNDLNETQYKKLLTKSHVTHISKDGNRVVYNKIENKVINWFRTIIKWLELEIEGFVSFDSCLVLNF